MFRVLLSGLKKPVSEGVPGYAIFLWNGKKEITVRYDLAVRCYLRASVRRYWLEIRKTHGTGYIGFMSNETGSDGVTQIVDQEPGLTG